VFDDCSLTTRAGAALLIANARYWPTVAPTVGDELKHWEQRAQAIPDKQLRTVALAKLHSESFNAEGTTTLATLVNRADRPRTAKAIVAMQVMYDYLDGLEEQTTIHTPPRGRHPFQAFADAVDPTAETSDPDDRPPGDDGHYLRDLTATVRDTLATLPARTVILPVAQRAARRCTEAQIRVHAPASTGPAELQAWAIREAAGTALDWREFLAGAATSALSVYALIAAGTDRRTTIAQATAIDAAYLSIGALATMLDSLIDHQHDLRMNTQWFLPYYEDRSLLTDRLAETARRAVTQARALPHGAHHVMTLVGVAAYYLSTPEASTEQVRPLITRLQRELRPLITPTLLFMRTWRAAKRAHTALHARGYAGHET
jgi:tetraprenyl-beta-curcumene synthase